VIQLRGYSELELKLGKITALRWASAGILAAATHLKGKIARYPAVSRRPQPFVSDKQRRGFFAKLRSGEIEVPYIRGSSPGSERLGQSWAVKTRNQGLTAVIGNDASYGRLVQDQSEQVRYHRDTGWQTVQDVVEQERRRVTEFFAEHLRRAMRG
jgi:hypothetical protein